MQFFRKIKFGFMGPTALNIPKYSLVTHGLKWRSRAGPKIYMFFMGANLVLCTYKQGIGIAVVEDMLLDIL